MHHGMLTVYKEKGYTSSDAVARLRGILRMRKIGHTGTLDPDAEGVLPMCLGNATRICELIADREKEYVAVMRLGVRTDTQDMSGNILSQINDREVMELLGAGIPRESRNTGTGREKQGAEIANENCDAEEDAGSPAAAEQGQERTAVNAAEQKICAAAERFVGEIDQVPPMYSAIKVNGKRLYDMARKGITVERKARRITIHSIEIEKIDLPLVTMRVRCSKGTYIRTLCEDMGNALGTGAAMQSLLRTRVGQFTLDQARTLDEIEGMAKTEPEALASLIRPVDSFFSFLPAAVCPQEALRLLKNGNALTGRQLQLLPADTQAVSNIRFAGTKPEKLQNRSLAEAAFSLPDTDPGDRIVRIYDDAGRFYGLYRRKKGQDRYTAYKMFLPQE